MIVPAKGSREKTARKEWNEAIFVSRPLRAGLTSAAPSKAGAAPTNGLLRAESSKKLGTTTASIFGWAACAADRKQQIPRCARDDNCGVGRMAAVRRTITVSRTPRGRRADFLSVRQMSPAGGGFLGEAAGEKEGVVVGRDVIVAAAADDLELVTLVEAEGGGVGAADFEDGLFGGEGARPAQGTFEKSGARAMASGIGADCEIQDFDFVGDVTGD